MGWGFSPFGTNTLVVTSNSFGTTNAPNRKTPMLGIQSAFIATTGTALDTVERGGKPRHSLRAAIRMPKRKKEDKDYPAQWVTLNIREFDAEYAKRIPVGTRVFIMGRQRTALSDDGNKLFVDVDVESISAAGNLTEATDWYAVAFG